MYSGDDVSMLLSRMRNNVDYAAICGCVCPVWSINPLVMAERHEYLWHRGWKSNECNFDAVTCTPGPFTMFREVHLTHVLGEYSARSKTPEEQLRQDYGEDRWLTMLLLKAGMKVKFCGLATAYTYVPDDFVQLILQRILRWLPSTNANTKICSRAT